MKFVTLNQENFLVEAVVSGGLVGAFKTNYTTVNLDLAKQYVQERGLKTLQDVSFGNAVFTARDLTPVELGYFTIVDAAYVQAEETAMAVIVNQQLDEILGEM